MIVRRKYLELCNLIWGSPSQKKIDVILNDMKCQVAFSDIQNKLIRKELQVTFLKQFNEKYQTVNRKKDIFKSRFKDFLEKEFVFDLDEASQSPEPEDENVHRNVKVGSPRVTSDDYGESTKYRRAKELALNYTLEELSLAVKLKQKDLK